MYKTSLDECNVSFCTIPFQSFLQSFLHLFNFEVNLLKGFEPYVGRHTRTHTHTYALEITVSLRGQS